MWFFKTRTEGIHEVHNTAIYSSQLPDYIDSHLCVDYCGCAYFANHGYEWTKNTISDLGAQGYDRKLIMQVGFLAFGLTLIAGVLLKGLTWRTMPILMYGLCVGLTGVFVLSHFLILTIILKHNQ
ncbi:MAG: DUF998 domain-containing protein [Saprospiraceae bacterium]|nr:DUF998 domain-containing protein [Saprospiraceae bacterium]